jgi:hypothetical protein
LIQGPQVLLSLFCQLPVHHSRPVIQWIREAHSTIQSVPLFAKELE